MRTKRTQLIRLPKNPTSKDLPSFLFLRHFSLNVNSSATATTTTAAEDDTAAVTQFVELLQSQDINLDDGEKLLRQLLSSSTSPFTNSRLLQIIRRLGNSSKALQFFQWIQQYTSSSSPISFSLPPSSSASAYQAIFELASKEPDYHKKLSHLLQTSRARGVPLTRDSASLLIRCFGRAHMITESIRLFNELDPSLRNTYLYNTLIDVLFKSDSSDDALRILNDMFEPDSSSLPNDITGSIVFSALLKKNVSEEKIIELVSKMGEIRVFPDVVRLTQLVTKFCRSGNTGRAWDVLHLVMKMGGVVVEVASCNSLLTGLGRERDFERMNLLMSEMKEMGIQPSVVTFGILINSLCKSRRVDDALQVFEKMSVQGENDGVVVQPDVITFNTLIDGLCKVGRQEEGLALVDRMKSKHACSPNTVTYNCLIDGFCKAGEIERSHELFERMKEEGVSPDVITMNSLIDGMCSHGRISRAVGFFRDMQTSGLKGNIVTYTTLINAFCHVNNIDKAMELFEEMVGSGCCPDPVVYYTLISGLGRAGRLDDAWSFALNMREAGFHLDTMSYNILISGFCKKKKLDKAYEILKQMEKERIRPDEVTHNTLIATFSKAGDFSTAHQLMRKMIDEGLVPTVVTHGALIHGYCRAGQLNEAMKIYRDMGSTSKIPPNTVIFNILIDSLCKDKKIEAALSLMDEMHVKGVPPNTITYNALFKGLQEKNLLDKAFELMDQMNTRACNPDYVTMEILTEWLSAVGETAKLKKFVEGYEVSVSSM